MKKFLILTLAIFSLTACQKEVKIQIDLPQKPQQSHPFKVHFNNINHSAIDKVLVKIDGQNVQQSDFGNEIDVLLNDSFKLGQHQLSFDFVSGNETVLSATKKIELYAGVKPKVLAYKLLNTYPHDINAFTQGLEFYKDTLYEGTGLNGESSLRKTDYKTGEIYKKVDLDRHYFGEGVSVLNDKVYQLTWQSGIGFIYNTNLDKIGDFKYHKSKEGWGLCNDGKVLYKSDGTEKIWQLDPKTLEETDYINVYTDKHKIVRINELEWVDGKIFTNVWQKNALAIINPKTGAVEGIVNLSDLHKKVTQHPNLDVLNGIAYNPKTKTLFVTGKKWDKMFEIQIQP
jgi:glutamine cyclotransferase